MGLSSYVELIWVKSGCGTVRFVLVWQVRCVGVRRVVLRLVPFRCGRFGESGSGTLR